MRQTFISSLLFCLLLCFELIIAPHPTTIRTTSKGSSHGGNSPNSQPSLSYSTSFDKTREASKHLSDAEVMAKGQKQVRKGWVKTIFGLGTSVIGGTVMGTGKAIAAKASGQSGRQGFKEGFWKGTKTGDSIMKSGSDTRHQGYRSHDVVIERHNPGHMAPPPEVAHNLGIRKQAAAQAEASSSHGGSAH